MPRLRKIEKAGFKFIIYTNDHTPMHVHVWKAEAQLIVNFENELELRENYGMSKKDARKAVEIISEQRMYLIEDGGGFTTMNEEEFEKQFEAATERGRIADLTQPQYQVEKVYYDKNCGFIVINLKNGAILQIPRQLLQGLKEATSEEIAQMELMPGGRALHWDNLDVHFTIPDLIQQIFGTKAWMAQTRISHKQSLRS